MFDAVRYSLTCLMTICQHCAMLWIVQFQEQGATCQVAAFETALPLSPRQYMVAAGAGGGS